MAVNKNERILSWPLANGVLTIANSVSFLQIAPVDPSLALEYQLETAEPAVLNGIEYPGAVTIKNQGYTSQSNTVNEAGSQGFSFRITPVVGDLIIVFRP